MMGLHGSPLYLILGKKKLEAMGRFEEVIGYTVTWLVSVVGGLAQFCTTQVVQCEARKEDQNKNGTEHNSEEGNSSVREHMSRK